MFVFQACTQNLVVVGGFFLGGGGGFGGGALKAGIFWGSVPFGRFSCMKVVHDPSAWKHVPYFRGVLCYFIGS